MESTRLPSMCAGRHAVAREKGRRGARFAGTARGRAGPARDFDRTIPRKGRDIAARANVRGIDAGQAPSRRRLSAPPKGRHSFARVVVMRLETHHSRLDAPALRLAGVCAFMFGSSARSLRQVLPPENIMSYRVSIGLLRRRPPPGQTRTFLPIKVEFTDQKVIARIFRAPESKTGDLQISHSYGQPGTHCTYFTATIHPGNNKIW